MCKMKRQKKEVHRANRKKEIQYNENPADRRTHQSHKHTRTNIFSDTDADTAITETQTE